MKMIMINISQIFLKSFEQMLMPYKYLIFKDESTYTEFFDIIK